MKTTTIFHDYDKDDKLYVESTRQIIVESVEEDTELVNIYFEHNGVKLKITVDATEMVTAIHKCIS